MDSNQPSSSPPHPRQQLSHQELERLDKVAVFEQQNVRYLAERRQLEITRDQLQQMDLGQDQHHDHVVLEPAVAPGPSQQLHQLSANTFQVSDTLQTLQGQGTQQQYQHQHHHHHQQYQYVPVMVPGQPMPVYPQQPMVQQTGAHMQLFQPFQPEAGTATFLENSVALTEPGVVTDQLPDGKIRITRTLQEASESRPKIMQNFDVTPPKQTMKKIKDPHLMARQAQNNAASACEVGATHKEQEVPPIVYAANQAGKATPPVASHMQVGSSKGIYLKLKVSKKCLRSVVN
ncbi:hypothetical protein KEM54_001999, partial [Ascosphaera aggregata]